MTQGTKARRPVRSWSRMRVSVGVLGWVLPAIVLAALSGCDDEGHDLSGDDLVVGDPPADELPVDEPPVDEQPIDELPADDPPSGDFSGYWVRFGYPDCQDTLPLQELPVEKRFIYNNRLTVEQVGDVLAFFIVGRQFTSGTLDGTVIYLDASYSTSIDAHPPLRYAEIRVDREGFALGDGDRLEFRDRYESYGDILVCDHVFDRA